MNDEYRELELQGKIVRPLENGDVAIFDPKTGWWENRGNGASTSCGPCFQHGETRAEKRAVIQKRLAEFLEEPDLRKTWKRHDKERAAKRQVEREEQRRRNWFWKVFDFCFLDRSKKF
jgi:hypothetical protein